MKTRLKRISIVACISLIVAQTFHITTPVSAQIPAEYKPNYKFAAERAKILDTKTSIDAKKQNGQAIDTVFFATLLKNFNVVFNYLPKTPDYKIVYESCRV